MDAHQMRIVSIYDSAIDREAMGKEVGTYATRRDPDILRFKPGLEPTWFTIRYLTRAERRWVDKAPDDVERHERAFRLAVVKIENLRTNPPNRQELAEATPRGKIGLGGEQREAWSEEQLEQIPDAYLEDIGLVSWLRSFLAHEPEIFYPLPPTSAYGSMAVVGSRRVDETPASSEDSGSSTS